MRYNSSKVGMSQNKLNKVGKNLQDVKGILNGVGNIRGFERASIITNIQGRIESLITKNADITNRIYSVVDSMETAEVNNEEAIERLQFKYVDVLKGQDIKVATKESNTRITVKRKFEPVKSVNGIRPEYKIQCPQQGTVHDDIIPGAYVYLPYNYDENAQYNIVLIEKGGLWFTNPAHDENGTVFNGQILIDNMIYHGEIDPCIVIAMHSYTSGSSSRLVNDNGNGILQLAAQRLPTYIDPNAEDKTQAVIDARDHIAVMGFSEGR